jgi:hypothetical protein
MFDGDMQCPECGPYPEQTIWDGTALSLNQKNVLSTLKPPTISDEGSTERSSCYFTKQQVIEDAALRKQVKEIIAGPQLLTKAELQALTESAVLDKEAAKSLSDCLQLVIHIDNVEVFTLPLVFR